MKLGIPHTVAGLLATGVLLAGCGSGASSASSGSATTSANLSSFQHRFVAFASCMRSHGVPDYPDPRSTSSGGVQISPGHANPNTPAFKSAQSACHELLPNGGAPAGGASAQAKAQDVKYADCMRAHGVPNFPDPSHDGGFDLPAGLDPQAPQFSHATKACQGVQPSSLAINQNGT